MYLYIATTSFFNFKKIKPFKIIEKKKKDKNFDVYVVTSSEKIIKKIKGIPIIKPFDFEKKIKSILNKKNYTGFIYLSDNLINITEIFPQCKFGGRAYLMKLGGAEYIYDTEGYEYVDEEGTFQDEEHWGE
jgi:hypothetical protein